jgi:hypothetical protein
VAGEVRMNKVVAHFTDGRAVKGFTNDFILGKEFFHLGAVEAPAGSKPALVDTKDLKALFFVREFAGDPKHRDQQEFDPSRPPEGHKIKVVFKDGEVLVGFTNGYKPGRPGFFLVPADETSNNERCYVVTAATHEITFI